LLQGKRTADEHRNCLSLPKRPFPSPGLLTCDFTRALFKLAARGRLSPRFIAQPSPALQGTGILPGCVKPLKGELKKWRRRSIALNQRFICLISISEADVRTVVTARSQIIQ
jgi:hypothetical protein